MRPGTRGYVAAIVAAQALVQIGAFTLPALLPHYMAAWSLSATEAGWLIGIFFAAYVAAVPVLMALTDRLPARSIYLIGSGLTALSHLGFAVLAEGFWSALALRALAGIGWAGAYMPGLKAIADPLSGNAQSRAVSLHAAGVGISGACSFLVAGVVDALAGPEAAFLVVGMAAALGFGIALAVMPGTRPAPAEGPRRALLDFRPVFRNRRALAWIAGYTVHTWEMAALRAWAVTFLAVAAAGGGGVPGWMPDPTALFTLAGLLGILVSLAGNEAAQRRGRQRVVTWAMASAAALSLATGWMAGVSFTLALVLVLAWNAAIYLDSAALTAGTVQAAGPGLRGATMGLHSMAGYAGGFVGPLGVGLALDLAGGDGALGWGLAFGHLAPVTLLGLFVLRRLGREGAAPPLSAPEAAAEAPPPRPAAARGKR
ncbi:MFS transporter [Crenalkalicoccus roseus]|uniref:MFS transporter n=1 Tax=Crenalkalicoccus roseus TaxID=1485588 RepID=UPI001081D524|nr:MFS transporter [Crenalkalicoccus roseus]